MTMTLYQVGLERQLLNDLLTSYDGELTLDTEQRLDMFLREGPAKIDAACMVVREKRLSEEALDSEIGRLEARKAGMAADRKRLESRILGAVDAAFDGKVKTNLFTVWGQTSAGTFVVDIAPDADLKKLHEADPELVKVAYALDKAKCRELMKTGVVINGVAVTEHPGTRYLRIK